MQNYRLYRLDGAGKIFSAEWISAESDEEAERLARDGQGQSSLEIWDRNRLVVRIESERDESAGG